MPGPLILIVEDNEKNLKLVRDILQFNGYQTVESRTAEKAIEIARTRQPALILMDIQLPGMDGVTALRHLRADPSMRRIPVMAITGSAVSIGRKKALEVGFEGYHAKPIRVRVFVEEVRRILNSRSETKGSS